MDFQIGTKKVTSGQRKKHHSQFSRRESEKIRKAKRHVLDLWLKRGIKTSDHLQVKIRNNETKFSYKRAMECLLNGQVIEYNEINGDKRILVRSNVGHVHNHIDNIVVQCVVVSLISGKVVTAYLNTTNDRHKTLDLRRYDETLKVVLPKYMR